MASNNSKLRLKHRKTEEECRYTSYSGAEQIIRHTLDGACWLSYSHEGEPFSGKTPPHIQEQLLTGEYIVQYKDGMPYLVYIGPGARDKLISEGNKLAGGRRKSRKNRNKKRKTRRRN
jgi:hypothetical protein